MRILITLIFLLLTTFLTAQVNLTNSTIPILIIETDGQPILDEPKTNVHLGIIDNGLGQLNNISDPFTNYDGIIGIELRGQTSQFFPKQPFGFETRNENGENNNVALLGMPAENDWVLHNPYSDKSLLRNVLAYKIAGELMDYAPRTRLCEVVINNEYQGVYVLTEKIKVDDNRVAIAKLKPEDIEGDELTGGYIVKIDKPFQDFNLGWLSEQQTFFYHQDPKLDELNFTQRQYIRGWLNEFESVLAAPNFADSISGYQNYIDVASFVDFFIVNEITRNVDGYRLSTYMHKDKDSNGGLLKMGPVWDFNLAFGNADYCDGFKTTGWAYQFNDVCEGDAWQVPFWWEQLMSDPKFKMEIKDRWTFLRNDFLSDENMIACIDSKVEAMGQATERNFQQWPILNEYVWPNSNVGGNYNNEITFLINWLLNRMEWMDGAIMDFQSGTSTGQGNTIMSVNPNPFKDELILSFNSSFNKKILFQLFNNLGQRTNQFSYQVDINGPIEVPLEIGELATGIYFYRILSSNELLLSGKLLKD